MSTQEDYLPQSWKQPNDLIKLQRLKLKKKQLAARLSQNNNKVALAQVDKNSLLEAKITQKRKNPFAKSSVDAKRPKVEEEESLLGFVNAPAIPSVPAKLVPQSSNAKLLGKLLQQTCNTSSTAIDNDDTPLDEQKFSTHLPIDWSIKTRVRFFCHSELPTTTLKTSQLASGLTSFVRCIDTQNTCNGLDISPATRFNQATYYWQQPYLPWLTLFPRNCKENIGITIGERERKALADDWDTSFRGLFQLLRARQCPYFYLCANGFTVLFRAAGIAGRVETHALMSPTTRGMRSALRQEGIEYTMPLKKDSGLNKSGDGSFTDELNSAAAKENEPKDVTNSNDISDDDDEGEEEWLESLGVDEKEIRRIQAAHIRQQKVKEMTEDFSDNSLILVEGVECQGFFSFLLNAKSSISNIGRLAGVPPTLLAPVAFPKASMQQLTTRSNPVRMDGVNYCSIEAKGVVLPTFLPYVFQLLDESKETFSATLATSSNTMAFSKATQKLLEMPNLTDEQHTEDEMAGRVFGEENLSDCGLLPRVIADICRTGQNAVSLLERVCYDRNNGYAWS